MEPSLAVACLFRIVSDRTIQSCDSTGSQSALGCATLAPCLSAQESVRATLASSPSWSWTSPQAKWKIARPMTGRTRMPWRSGDSAVKRGGWRGPRLYLPNEGRKSPISRRESDGRAPHGMTINVALVTSHAVVLGCDSTASVTGRYLDPFSAAVAMQKDGTGNIKLDKSGRATIKFKFDALEEIVTDAWGGVTKMFELCSNGCHCAAITSGLATLNDRPIASIAEEFHEAHNKTSGSKIISVKDAADAFLGCVRTEYDEHYKNSQIPAQFREGPEFLLGGYGKTDTFGSIYRILVKENKVETDFKPGKYGLSWNAQSDAVERVMRGYDRELRRMVEKEIDETFKRYSNRVNRTVLRIVERVLKKLNATMPKGINYVSPKCWEHIVTLEQGQHERRFCQFATARSCQFRRLFDHDASWQGAICPRCGNGRWIYAHWSHHQARVPCA